MYSKSLSGLLKQNHPTFCFSFLSVLCFLKEKLFFEGKAQYITIHHNDPKPCLKSDVKDSLVG